MQGIERKKIYVQVEENNFKCKNKTTITKRKKLSIKSCISSWIKQNLKKREQKLDQNNIKNTDTQDSKV